MLILVSDSPVLAIQNKPFFELNGGIMLIALLLSPCDEESLESQKFDWVLEKLVAFVQSTQSTRPIMGQSKNKKSCF